jgi:hypothetical protein
MVFRVLLLLSAMLGALTAVAFSGEAADLAQDRVFDLPQDDSQWYVSVVGPEAERGEILTWFDTHPGLADLKRQTHFCTPTFGSPIYQERYATNIKATPTVRLQDAEGVVLYEVAGQKVPQTAQGLFDGLADAIRGRRKGRVLPWRRGIENQLKQRQEPQEEPPVDVPPLNIHEGPPEVPEPAGVPASLAALACLAAALLGAAGGVAVAYRQE